MSTTLVTKQPCVVLAYSPFPSDPWGRCQCRSLARVSPVTRTLLEISPGRWLEDGARCVSDRGVFRQREFRIPNRDVSTSH